MGLFPGACIVASDSLRLARAQPPTGKSKNNTPRKITTRFITVNWMKQQQFALDGEKQSALSNQHSAPEQAARFRFFEVWRLLRNFALSHWPLAPAKTKQQQHVQRIAVSDGVEGMKPNRRERPHSSSLAGESVTNLGQWAQISGN